MLFLVLWILFCLGHVSCTKYTVNDTLFYNVTGTINTLVEHARDILDTESLSYQEITGNLTRGFLKLFPTSSVSRFDPNITIMKVFLCPSSCEIETGKKQNPSSYEIETGKKQNLSFVLIVRYAFFTTPEYKYYAEKFLRYGFWPNLRGSFNIKNGIVNWEGLEIKKDTLKLRKIAKEDVNNRIRILNNYMAFITKLGDSDTKPAETGRHGVILIVAYVGITLSVAGLSITVFSICYFRRLRRFRGNQILIHICLTVMVGMILSVVAFLKKGEKTICTGISILLHYFILAALSWMCVEAYNLYRDLVKVFNNNILSTRVFFIRACLFSYGIPAVIVSVVALADLQVYGQRNDACWMTSLAFLLSFLVPVLLIVTVNAIFFVLIMREIVQVSQRDVHNIKPSLRAAISLSVVLGFCWLLAGISTFYSNPFFRYAFVVMSSFQGFFIFIFHGIGKQELRDSWKSLAIFKWQSRALRSSTESNVRAKTESTQDALQPAMSSPRKNAITGRTCDAVEP